MRRPLSAIDPITLAILRNSFSSAAREMYWAFKRTVMLPILYEYNDFGMSLYDDRLELLADAPGLPLFLGSMDVCIERTLEKLGGPGSLRPGDILINNHPFLTGGQPADAGLIEPIFHGGEVVGYSALRAHMGDVGAKGPYPLDSTDMFQEGTLYPGLKVYDEGRLNETLITIVAANSRLPVETVGSIVAGSAALQACSRKLVAVIDRYGLETYRAAVSELVAQGEQAVRAAVAAIPDGTYSCRDEMDDNGVERDPVPLSCDVQIAGDDITIDLSGSAGTQRGPINCPWAYTVTTCRFALKRILTPDMPVNGGEHKPLRVIAPEGSIFNPLPPAPTFLGAGTSLRLADMIVKAFADALPDRIPADSAGDLVMTMAYVSDPATRRTSFFFDAGAIGHGAVRGADGMNGLIHSVEAGIEALPTEILEVRMPVIKHRFELVTDSGGPGEFRGGLSAEAEFEFAGDGLAVVWAEKARVSRPEGLQGGLGPPSANETRVFPGTERELRLGKKADIPIVPGDRIVVRPAGGGGYGDPRARDPERVAADVRDEYVSHEAARRFYGVVIDPESGEPDRTATDSLRRHARAEAASP